MKATTVSRGSANWMKIQYVGNSDELVQTEHRVYKTKTLSEVEKLYLENLKQVEKKLKDKKK